MIKSKIILAALCISLCRCGYIGQPTCNVRLMASNKLNLSDSGGSLPLMLKICTISDKEIFIKSSYLEHYTSNQQDCIRKYIYPSQTLDVVVGQTSKYLGVVAFFNKPNKGKWLLIEEMPKQIFLRNIKINVGKNQIEKY